ncbi:FTR1 family protein [Metabacillus sp. GX 13764]|uniref:FTR1 family iron permease n=1 Tax=Metabacillus kandeliae TaxID=2900151 RepID=UPI001E2CD032|nr:FTR1 family protein [Metabacillus kandeliae]MCD7035265.1 FTR1 family protein [Metabacillus kandeliae]
MLSSFILALREGLEAALIIGIILIHTTKINRRDLRASVYLGVVAGLFISVIGGFIGFSGAEEMEGAAEEIFEGITMLIAAGLIAYFILWLHRHKDLSASVTSKVSSNSSKISLFILSFLSVFREGLELMIFNLTQISHSAGSLVIGNLLGILLAVLIAAAIFKAAVKLNLSLVFKLLGIVLIFLGAEMFGEGLEKLFEGGGELLEKAGFVLFILPALYVFLKDDVRKLRERKNVNKTF